MGDMADYYMDIDMMNEAACIGIAYRILQGKQDMYNIKRRVANNIETHDFTVWTTKSGAKLPITKMTDVHLENTINMLMHKNLDNKSYIYVRGFIKSMSAELNRRNIIKNKKEELEMSKISNVKLKVVGVTFANENNTSRQNIISIMNEKSPVYLKREPQNKFDTNAVAVHTADGQVGYIAKEYASIMSPMMDQGKQFNAKVAEVGQYEGTFYLHIIINEV